MKSILVTGACGFIGSYVVRALLAGGSRVLAVDHGKDVRELLREASGGAESLPSERLRTADLDLTDAEAVRAFAEAAPHVDAVIHLAASLSMTGDSSLIVNCLGTNHVVELTNRLGAEQLIYMSSIPVIGTPEHIPVTESHPVAPKTVYHISKLAGEQMAAALTAPSVRTLIFRISSPIGVGMNPRNFLTFLIRQCRENEPVTLYGRGARVQNYIDVRDIADTLAKAVGTDAEGLYLLAGESASNLELAELVKRETGSWSDIVPSDRPDPEAADRWVISAEKAARDLGFSPKHTLADSVRWILDA
ncbi:MAG: NAD(P)-dependent oxidoreductase [Eubacteriales bacterium]|nr:NAD(P)-dependent oxidoreductase [Eubacteriales bacterium]